MAQSPRRTSPPSPAACERLWQTIREASGPLTAAALGKLLGPEHRIAPAALAGLLESAVAAGTLLAMPPDSPRGKPRFWDRPTGPVIDAALGAAIRQAERPLTAREVRTALGLSFKISETEWQEALTRQLAAGALHAIPPATPRGQPRYWSQDVLSYGLQTLVATLASRGPQTASALKKSLKGIDSTQIAQIVDQALAQRRVWRHPPVGKSKHELLGATPPAPEPYLREVGSELARVVARLQAAEVPPRELRRAVLELVEAAGVAVSSGTLPSPSAAAAPVDLVALMHRLEPGARRGALVTSRDLRRAAQLEKPVFDRAVLDLARQGRLSLHRHDYASSLTAEERDDLVADGAGGYYVGMALRAAPELQSVSPVSQPE